MEMIESWEDLDRILTREGPEVARDKAWAEIEQWRAAHWTANSNWQARREIAEARAAEVERLNDELVGAQQELALARAEIERLSSLVDRAAPLPGAARAFLAEEARASVALDGETFAVDGPNARGA